MAEPLAAPQQPVLLNSVEIAGHEDGIQEREQGVSAPAQTDPVILREEEVPLSPVESHRKTGDMANEETEATTTETDALSTYSCSSSSYSSSFDDDDEEEEPEKGTQQLEEVTLCDDEDPAAETGDICSNNNDKSQTAKDTESQPPSALDATPSSQDELLAAALARKRTPSRGNSFFGQESLRNLLSMGASTRQLGGGSSSQHGMASARSTHSTTSSAGSAAALAAESETGTTATSAPPQRPPLSFIQPSVPSSSVSPQLEEATLREDEDVSAEAGNICSNNSSDKSQTAKDTEPTQPPPDASSQDELLAAALARKARPKMPSRGNSFFGQESLRNLLSMGTSTRQLGGAGSQHGERSTHSTTSSAGSASSLAPELEADTTASSTPQRPPLSFIQSSSVPSSPASQSNLQELVFREEGAPLGMHLDTDTLQVLEMGPPAVQVCHDNQQPPHIFHGAVVVAVNGSGGPVADLWELLKDPSRPKAVQFRLAPQQQPRQNGAVASNSSSFLGFSLAKQLSVKHLFGNSDSIGDAAIPEQEEAEPLPLGTPQRSSSKAVRSMSSPSLFGSLSRQMSFKTPFFGAVPEDDNEKEEDDDEDEDNQTRALALTRNEAPLSTKNEHHNKKQPPKRTPSDSVTLSSSDVSSVEMAEEEEEEDEMEVYQRARQSRLLNDICDLELNLSPKTTTATSVGVKRVRFHIDDTTTKSEAATTEEEFVSAEEEAQKDTSEEEQGDSNDDNARWYHHKELQQFESEMLDQVRALWNEEQDRSSKSPPSGSPSSFFFSSLLAFPNSASSGSETRPETSLQCFRQALRTSRRARGEDALETVGALLQQGDWLQPVYDKDDNDTTTLVGLEQRLLRPSRGTPVGCVRFVLEQAKYQEKREQDHNDNTLAIVSQIVSRPSRLLAQEVARAQAAALRDDNHND